MNSQVEKGNRNEKASHDLKGKRKGQAKPSPKKLKDFRGQPPSVSVTRSKKNAGDAAATKILMDLYSQPDGWHCPKCGEVIIDGDEAVSHLAKEINEAFARLGR